MKFCHILVLGLAFLGTPAHAQDVAATYRSDYKGNRYDFTVRHFQVLNTPDWKEDADNPPLSPRKAVAAARIDLARFLPNASQWTRRSISLVEVGAPRKWMYVIEFAAPAAAADDIIVPMRVLVLMDGFAVRPTIKSANQ